MNGEADRGFAPGGRAAEAPRVSLWARTRSWLRGEPLHVPSHALVVHFPAALLPTSLAFDVVAWANPNLGFARAAIALIALGLAGGLLAAATGLLDWLEMFAGARRARVTRHLLVQVGALIAFALSLVIRVGEPDRATAPAPAVVASLVGLAVLLVGNHLGGLLVYRDGMRVRSSRER